MVRFEVGKVYDNGTRWVCVWRGRGKKPRAHFVEQWEHEMNLVEDMADYEASREFDGRTADNNVHPIHERNGVEVAMWDYDQFLLSASMCVGSAQMKMTKKERTAAREKIDREQSVRECKEFYSSVARGAGRGTAIVAKKSAGFVAKVIGAFAYIFSSKSTPKYSRKNINR